jgi:hypothetical protein
MSHSVWCESSKIAKSFCCHSFTRLLVGEASTDNFATLFPPFHAAIGDDELLMAGSLSSDETICTLKQMGIELVICN